MLLDDTSILGALPMMKEAENIIIKEMSERLLHRKLLKCIDLHIDEHLEKKGNESTELKTINNKIEKYITDKQQSHLLFDSGSRPLYKKDKEDGESLRNRIYHQDRDGKVPKKIEESSKIVKAIKPFTFARIYYDKDTQGAKEAAENIRDNLAKIIKP